MNTSVRDHMFASFARRLACLSLTFSLPFFAANSVAQAAPDDARLLERGRALAVAADCMACHTQPNGGRPFAGGYAIASPLGSIYATNITPSKSAGIGQYTEADFTRALREGIRKDGSHLYPAMPYTAYTQLSDDDVLALYTYFMRGVEPVDTVAPVTELPFPFNIRLSMMGWNLLYLDNKRFTPDPAKSEQINRGAYLAGALAHCSTCHTPRNALMGEDLSRALGGGQVGPWYAPNITSDKVSGIGAWTNEELVQYLRTGRVVGKAQAAGPMAEAVEHSLQHLPDADLQAIAAYLRSTAPVRNTQELPAAALSPAPQNGPTSSEAERRGMDPQTANLSLRTGAALYSGYCASCHQPNGAGSVNQAYPALFHNTATNGPNPSNLVATILYGVDRSVGDQHILMPRFDELSYVDPLTNEQIAAIANYVLAQYGNKQVSVSMADVQTARDGGPVPLLAKLRIYMAPLGVGALLLICLLILLRIRRRHAH